MNAIVLLDATLAVQLSEDQVRQVREEIAAAIEAANQAHDTLRAIGGPEPGTFANQLAFKLNTGAGFLRSAQADIDAAWRARNVAARHGGDAGANETPVPAPGKGAV